MRINSKLIVPVEVAVLYLLTLIFLHFFLGEEGLSMNSQPNLYLAICISLTLYSGSMGLILGFTEYLIGFFFFYKTLPQLEDLYTLIAFGSLSFFFHLLNAKNVNLLTEINEYLQEKLDELLRNFYLLKVAYEQIFKKYVINMSIREILEELKKEYTEMLQKGTKDLDALYKMLESILFNEFEVRSFAIYAKNSKEEYERIFSSENYKEIPDHIWQDITEKLRYNSIIKAADVNLETQGFLACVPVMAENEEIPMFLIIQKMEFRAYNIENLQLIAIVLSYFYRYMYSPLRLIIPEFDLEFNKDLELCINLKKKYDLNSTIVIIKCVDLPNDFAEELFSYIRKYTRSLDSICVYNGMLIVLLNLTNIHQAEAYINKIKTLVKKDWTIDVDKNLEFKLIPVTTDIDKLRRLVKEI